MYGKFDTSFDMHEVSTSIVHACMADVNLHNIKVS